jgi:hypothetical protein
MHTANFSNNPVYKALSYVWGTLEDTSTIIVNGIPTKATKNLASALRHIRHNRLAEIIWVDAICINQRRITERNHQVSIMPRIYTNAKEVIAWLGDSYDDSDEAMGLLHRWGSALAEAGIDCYEAVRPSLDWFQDRDKADELITSIKHAFSEKAWKALASLYQRPYWRRLWIFQEFVLAEHITVMCGPVRVDGSHLLADVFFACWEEAFANSELVLSLGGPGVYKMVEDNMSFSHIRYMLHDLLRCRNVFRYASSRWDARSESLLQLIYAASFRNCTDARDYVYSMAGFAPIFVNYALSVEETYMQFAGSRILGGDFEILCFAGVGYGEEGMDNPERTSWTPIWAGTGKTRRLMPRPYLYKIYSAGVVPGSTANAPRVGSARNEIIISGLIIDTVEAVLEGWSDWETPMDERWKDMLFSPNQAETYINGMPLLQAYFRTLLADADCHWQRRLDVLHELQEEERSVVRPTVAGFGANFISHYCINRPPSTPEPRTGGSGNAPQSARRKLASFDLNKFFAKEEEPGEERWAQSMDNAEKHGQVFVNARRVGSEGRSFFTTPKGFMGTGPPLAKKGDVVCVIKDARVPFLLRRHGTGYLLVGEAFVLGLMDGEVRRYLNVNQGWADITLC